MSVILQCLLARGSGWVVLKHGNAFQRPRSIDAPNRIVNIGVGVKKSQMLAVIIEGHTVALDDTITTKTPIGEFQAYSTYDIPSLFEPQCSIVWLIKLRIVACHYPHQL